MHSAILDLSSGHLDLEKIVARYQDIEDQISTKATVDAIEFLSRTAYTQNQVTIEGLEYLVVSEISPLTRTYTLAITPVQRSRSQIAIETHELLTAGLVTTVTIRFPTKLRRQATKALSITTGVFKNQYRFVEVKFLEEYGQLQNTLFDGLEAILSKCFASANTPANMAYLSITSTASGKYAFHLGCEQVRVVLQELKTMKEFPMAPLQGVLGFILDDAVGAFSRDGLLTPERFVTLPFTRVQALEGVKVTNQVQNFLLGSGISVLEICRIKGLSLQVSCAPKNVEHVMKIIEPVRDEIKRQFQTNVPKYSLRRSELTAAWQKRLTRKESKLRILTAVAIEIITKTLAELAAKASGLEP